MTLLKQEAIEAFDRDGAVVLRGYFVDWLDSLRQGIDRNISDPSEFVRDYQEEGGGRFFGDYCNWQRFEEYRDFLYRSPSAQIASELMQSQQAQLFHEHVLVKEPGTELATPWHHDQPYYCVDGEKNCSLWLALDSVPLERSPEFIAGSHRWGKMFKPERFDGSPLNHQKGWEVLPNIEENRSDYQILQWAVEPGDAVAFHFKTLHGAPANRSGSQRRRAFSSRWVGDDAVFADRQGTISPPFPDCQLRHGERLSGPEFPVVYQR